MTALLTVLTAILAVFILMIIWTTIDRVSNKYLGERTRCAHAVADERTRRCCGKHPQGACPLEDHKAGHPSQDAAKPNMGN